MNGTDWSVALICGVTYGLSPMATATAMKAALKAPDLECYVGCQDNVCFDPDKTRANKKMRVVSDQACSGVPMLFMFSVQVFFRWCFLSGGLVA